MATARQPESVDGDGETALVDKYAAWDLAQRDGWLSLPRVTVLGVDAAMMLAWHRGTLALDGLAQLPAALAAMLCCNAGDLHLRGLRTLDAPAAAALARHKGLLALDGLETLPPAVAAALEQHRGGMSLDGLSSLSPPIAAALARSRGGLRLRGITALPADIASQLAAHRGPLWLDGITSLDPAAAHALAAHEGWLFLRSLGSLDDETAQLLGRHSGRLFLDGIGPLSAAAAPALARHRGPVSLPAPHGPPRGGSGVDRRRSTQRPVPVKPAVSSRAASACLAEQTTSGGPIGIAILGAGFAGLCMGIRLLEAGREDFTIFEKAGDLGGTWRDNTYPGCACDVPTSVYSYSFARHPGWSRAYAGQAEILDYMRRVARDRGVDRRIAFRTAITAATWNDELRLWDLTDAAGRHHRARVVVAAVGGLHLPKVPDIPGLDGFRGPVMHTARWRHDVDLAGRNVAVIGTGTSAAQVIPELAKRAETLAVFQRSPPWVLPRRDAARSAWVRRLERAAPWLGRISRAIGHMRAEIAGIALTGTPRLVGGGQRLALRHLRRSVPDGGLQRKLTPRYALGCKRVVLSDDLYPALSREHVDVVLEGIDEIRPASIVTVDGRERPIDAIVLATGFRPFNIAEAVAIHGRDGRDLAAEWRDGPRAFQGVAIAGYPNLFTLMGPNTALGHNSVLFMIETQVRYVMRCLDWLAAGHLDAIEVREQSQRDFNGWLDERFTRTVWKAGGPRGAAAAAHKVWRQPCASWYVHPSGRNHVIWPGSSLGYWLRMRRPDRADFLPRESRPAGQPARRAA